MKLARLLLALPLPILVVALAACQQERKPASEPMAQVQSGLAVSEGRLVLPAVKGNPGAAYFVIENKGAKAVSLAAVSIEGAAKAEMHQSGGGSMTPVEQVALAPGARVAFAPGGLHVMVFKIDPKVQAGGDAKMTLTFADGEMISVSLKAETVGGSMEGMDHGDMH